MRATNLIAVFIENKPGQTARVTKILADAGVDIRWVTIAHSGSFGVMKFLVNKLEAAMQALKEQGIMVSPLPVLAVEVPNNVGSLQGVAELLARHQLNLANCSGFVANQRAILLIELQELAQASTVLENGGLRLLSQDELLHL